MREEKVLHFATCNGLSIHQFLHTHTKKEQHDDREKWKIKADGGRSVGGEEK